MERRGTRMCLATTAAEPFRRLVTSADVLENFRAYSSVTDRPPRAVELI